MLIKIVAPLIRGAGRAQGVREQAPEDHVDGRLRLLEGYSWFQPRHDLQPHVLICETRRWRQKVAAGIYGVLHRERDPKVGRLPHSRADEPGRRDPHHLERRLMDLDGFPDSRGIEAEAFLPKAVADDCQR